MNIQDLKKDSLHHAYIVRGGVEQLGELLSIIESLLETKIEGNPDTLVLSDDALTVGMARKVVERAGSASMVAGARKVIVLAFAQVTPEAQNALLKTLEEPSEGIYFFMLTPNPAMLLPTILSRCEVVEMAAGSSEAHNAAQKFINNSPQERIKLIEALNKKKDKATMMQLLNGVERYLQERKELPEWQLKVRAVLNAQEYIRDKGAMSKMLMESMALVV